MKGDEDMNVYQLERKCSNYIDRINEFEHITKLKYECSIPCMNGYNLFGRDNLGRVLYTAHFETGRELFQFLRGILHVLEVKQ